MTMLDTLLGRNHEFALHQFKEGQQMMPALRAIIIGCVDPRVDPALLLGLQSGEAVVIRNIGGRITPATFQAMGMLQAIAQVQGANLGSEFQLIVLHHTDCGITRLAEKQDMLANYFGVEKTALQEKAVSDPHASVAVDVAMLKNNPLLPGTWLVSGLVYDVTSGEVHVVIPPAPLR